MMLPLPPVDCRYHLDIIIFCWPLAALLRWYWQDVVVVITDCWYYNFLIHRTNFPRSPWKNHVRFLLTTRPIAEVIAEPSHIPSVIPPLQSAESAGHRIAAIALKESITWTFTEAFAKAIAWTFPEVAPKKPSQRTLQESSQEPPQEPSHVHILNPFQ